MKNLNIFDKIATIGLYLLFGFVLLFGLAAFSALNEPPKTIVLTGNEDLTQEEHFLNKDLTTIENSLPLYQEQYTSIFIDAIRQNFTKDFENPAKIQQINNLIKLIGKNPRKAEKGLRKFYFDPYSKIYQDLALLYCHYLNPYAYGLTNELWSIQLAKMYLAYIYMTDKVKVKNKKQLVNNIMKDVIDNELIIHNGFFPGRYTPDGKDTNERNSIKEMFYTMKFIDHDVPMWVLREQPQLTLDVLISPYFGSYADSFIASLDKDSTFIDISRFKHVQKILDYTSNKYAVPDDACGSMKYSYYIKVDNLEIKTVYSPISFINISNFDFATGSESDASSWNKAWEKLSKDKVFMQLYARAKGQLIWRYRHKFKLSSKQANLAAKNALASMLVYRYYNPFGMFKTKAHSWCN